jgi:hypothetical protein
LLSKTPMAPKVPIKVDKRAAETAMMTVLPTAIWTS